MLYFVATPIGNLKDVSYRAIEVLNSVDEIACEDTRHSLTFLNHYNIKKPLFSYHKFNEKTQAEKIIEKLKSGKNIAIISDAGMPVISDPGGFLIPLLQENRLEYTVVPGANAALSALILSGLSAERFCFVGFLPEKKTAREKLLQGFKNVPATLIFYSAPHDVEKDVKTLYTQLGDRKACAVKEITKLHENVVPFTLKEGIKEEIKGEYVILVEGGEEENPLLNLSEKEHLEYYVKRGIEKKEALKMVAKDRGVSKSEIYKILLSE